MAWSGLFTTAARTRARRLSALPTAGRDPCLSDTRKGWDKAGIEPAVGSDGDALAETINALFEAEVVNYATLEWVDRFTNRRLCADREHHSGGSRGRPSRDSGSCRYGRVTNPNQSTIIEGLWRTVISGWASLNARKTGSQAKVGIGRWITFHNHRGPGTARHGLRQHHRN